MYVEASRWIAVVVFVSDPAVAILQRQQVIVAGTRDMRGCKIMASWMSRKILSRVRNGATPIIPISRNSVSLATKPVQVGVVRSNTHVLFSFYYVPSVSYRLLFFSNPVGCTTCDNGCCKYKRYVDYSVLRVCF